MTPESRFCLEVRRIGNLQCSPISFTDVRVIHYTCLNGPMVYREEQCVAITNKYIYIYYELPMGNHVQEPYREYVEPTMQVGWN